MSLDITAVLQWVGSEYEVMQARVSELTAANSILSAQLAGQGIVATAASSPAARWQDRFELPMSPSRLKPSGARPTAVPSPLGGPASAGKRQQPQFLPPTSHDSQLSSIEEAQLPHQLPHDSETDATTPVWRKKKNAGADPYRQFSSRLSGAELEFIQKTRSYVIKRVGDAGKHLTMRAQLARGLRMSNRGTSSTMATSMPIGGGRFGEDVSTASSAISAVQDRQRLRILMVDSLLGVAVILNTFTIGLSADLGDDNPLLWISVDAVFALLFLSELVFKLYVAGWRDYFCGQDWRWGFFEAGLVAFAILEVVLAALRLGGAQDATVSEGEDNASASISLFRIVRLMRITRILRLVRLDMFSELMVMIRGTLGGIRTLAWSIILISLPLYIVALVLREMLGESSARGQGAESFSTVPESFFTVFRCVVAGECTEAAGRPIFLSVTATYGWGYGVLYCCTMIFFAFGLFNVIVAIFVENVIAGARFNEHIKKQTRLRDRLLFLNKTAELLEIILEEHQRLLGVGNGRGGSGGGSAGLQQRYESSTPSSGTVTPQDSDRGLGLERPTVLSGMTPPMVPPPSTPSMKIGDLEVTPALFEGLRKQERFQQVLRDLDIADEDQFDLFDTLDVDGSGTVDIDELLAGVAKLRGDPRRSDIVSVSLLLRSMQTEQRDFYSTAMQLLSENAKALRRLQAPR